MTSPLKILDWTTEYFIANRSKCNVILNNPDVVKEIPFLNYVPLDYLRDQQLVRFRGMIQDMHNPEYYFQQYEVRNKQSNVQETRCGMYADFARCMPHEEILLESEKNCSAERHTCFIISTPGLNEWVKEKYEKPLCVNSNRVTTNKRTFEQNECEAMDCSETVYKRDKISLEAESKEMDITEHNETKQTIISKEYILNFPIPMNDGRACIVKIYEDAAVKLNQIIEIVGFVSLDPLLSNCNMDETMTEAESNVHYPPASLVPRLHAIKLIHCSEGEIERAPEIISKTKLIRSNLHLVLSQLLFGDHLAADYLICHLLSSVFMRKDCFCLGNYPLNLTHFSISKHKTFAKNLYKFLTMFVEKSHFLEVTLDNLNDLTLSPKKDYDCNRLTSGVLQLSDNTHLIIDETGLTTGQVSSAGWENYNTICDLINFQKVTYDFKFYKMDYETDIPVLILSEAKSFIPCQNQVVLKIDTESDVYPHVIEIAEQYLKDENRLADIRQYLKVIRKLKFKFDEGIVKEVQNDFVKMRQTHKNVSIDHLHSLMVLARFLSLSHGSNTLTTEYWKMAVQMEVERLGRLPEKKEV